MSVTAPKGFAASGVEAGIRHAKKDVAVVHSTERAVGGAMFSRNKVQAACLQVNRAHLAAAEPQAVVLNSGIANSSTGAKGYENATATAAHAAGLLGLETNEVLVLSTGVIGMHLPMDRLLPGVDTAVAALAADGGSQAAEAIMTTDTTPKETLVACDGFTVGGMAKGAGMIHPDLATMLSVISTDYPLAPGEATGFLRPAVHETFNAITVDGDCSTNDTVILLANGASGIERTPESDASFAAALLTACADLSRQIVADGEGATVLAEINVRGAVDARQAKAIAQRIATSVLVKTALFGHDANWGRVLMAAGSAPYNGDYADVDADRATLRYNDTLVLDHGSPTNVEPDVSGPSCTIELDLGLGDGTAAYLTSDLSYDYVRINADYRS
jgi:glutamate N-acetyltransferase / amino-acid N-acetyltransferase